MKTARIPWLLMVGAVVHLRQVQATLIKVAEVAVQATEAVEMVVMEDGVLRTHLALTEELEQVAEAKEVAHPAILHRELAAMASS